MIQRLRYFNSMHDLLIFFQIVMIWSFLPLLLLFPLERVLRLLTPSLRISPRSISAQKIICFTNYWFSRKPIAILNSCLKRSLVLYYMMNRYGHPVKFCLGIKKENFCLTGHSWIESKTGAIAENQSIDQFVVIYTYPTS